MKARIRMRRRDFEQRQRRKNIDTVFFRVEKAKVTFLDYITTRIITIYIKYDVIVYLFIHIIFMLSAV